MNVKKLDEIGGVLDGQVERGDVAGGSVLVLRDGKEIYRHNSGMADIARNIPVEDDTIFRIYSMTKPVTAAALMILHDRGMFDFEDSLSKYLPFFKDITVLDEDGKIVPAKREITIGEVVNMTSGLVYPDMAYPAGIKMEEVYHKYYEESEAGARISTRELMERAAKSPLAFQPGEKWLYGIGADVAGLLIEELSGMSFREFLKKELFEPLGMPDTDFYVPKEKLGRFSEMYLWNDNENRLEGIPWQHLGLRGFFKEPPAFESGGAGLVSTADDYAKFASMLIHGGVSDGRRILSENAVKIMSTDSLTPRQRKTCDWDQCRGCGYSCLNRVLTDPSECEGVGNVGEYGWDGWLGTYYSNDPIDKITLIYMIQRCGGFGSYPSRQMKKIIYEALK
ncbi:serine hydrolase domain-containing protein [Ruminococcus sp. Marseille-P6503]|uniref:serine hydrolase domain-containing protein n=1 Tax=Ruminococcus sp. Marseille-P6503 TaxID=2364796 RepID=UPI000F532572|nr:serine hydrolase domain-containing protein [Ruminococcus sp. Marseille-P6503]